MTNQQKIEKAFLYATLAETSYVIFDDVTYTDTVDAIDAMVNQFRIPRSLADTIFASSEKFVGSYWHR